jgi:ABC-type amino acid transport substrate-binding protein
MSESVGDLPRFILKVCNTETQKLIENPWRRTRLYGGKGMFAGRLLRHPACLARLLPLLLVLATSAHPEGREGLRAGMLQSPTIAFQDSDGEVRGLYVDLLDAIAQEEGWEGESKFLWHL